MKYNYTQPANELQRFADMVEFPDAEPTENSAQLVTSGGVYDAIQAVEEEAKQLSYNSLMEDSVGPAAIVTFPDGAENVPVKELTADIEPIQDLHGQASPWPAGGGDNIFEPESGTVVNENVTIVRATTGVYGISGSNSGSGPQAVRVSKLFTLKANKAYYIKGFWDGLTPSNNTCRISLNTNYYGAGLVLDELTGGSYTPTEDTQVYLFCRVAAGYTIPSGVIFKPYVTTNPDLSNWSPYSNICPIEGYTGAEITRCVWGMHNIQMEMGTFNNGQPSEHLRRLRTVDYIPVTEGKTYTISATASKALSVFIACFGSNTASSWVSNIATAAEPRTFTCPTNVNYIRFVLLYADDTAISPTDVSEVTVVETPTTTYSVSWSDHGTIYKGTAQYKGDGEWEITADNPDTSYIELDGTEGWTLLGDGTNQRRFASATVASLGLPAADITDIENTQLCSQAVAHSFNDGVWGQFRAVSVIVFNDKTSHFADAAALSAYFAAQKTAGTPVAISYKVATPVTFTVNGPDPETLLGDNNMWSNTGDISVRYRCNTALYIEKKLGA